MSTTKEVCQHFAISDRTLRDWKNDPTFPPVAGTQRRPLFEISAIEDWRALRFRNVETPESNELRKTLSELKYKKLEAELEQLKIDNRTKETKLSALLGAYVPRPAVELLFSKLLTDLGDWCDQLPELVAGIMPKSHQSKLKKRLAKELNDRRNEMEIALTAASREFDNAND